MDRSAMTGTVLIAGPADVLGTRVVDAELVSAAFECIDDPVALVDDRIVPVDVVWREVMATAVDPGTRTVALVCPSWWRSPRIDLVRDAARQVAANVVLIRRSEVLRGDRANVIVEMAEDFVVIHMPDAPPAVVPRMDDRRTVIDAIVTRIADSEAVVIDVPGGIAGAKGLGDDLAHTLRLRAVTVSMADDQRVMRAAEAGRGRRRRPTGGRRIPRLTPSRVAAVTCIGLVVALAGAAAGYGADDSETTASTWLVEGRVAVEVPADWPTERVVVGPGSARVQVVSPSEPHVAIHLTQSPGQESLPAAAEVLRRALGEQPDGVFVDFTATTRRAERNVITYREVRQAHHVEWTVMLDRGVRIAIGCQHPPDRPAPEQVCDHTIRSARVLA